MISRLEIQINDTDVLFHGRMSTREAFDFINYFDKEGFTEIEIGDENSCLHLSKPIHQKDTEKSGIYLNVLNERNKLIDRVKELEDLIKNHIEQSLPESEIIYGV